MNTVDPRQDQAVPDEPDELAARLISFLDANAEIRPTDEATIGSGMFALHTASGDLSAAFEASRAFQAALFDAGLAGLSVPIAYGGQGLGLDAERTLARQFARYLTPHPMPLSVGLGLVVPTIVAHGTDEQKQAHIAATLRGDQVWCQLFSEPEAGSDLAGLRTVAVPDGDHWRITGQKVWTSFATFADFGILLARTDPQAPKHRGITMFIVDMSLPGVDIKPLREMTGGSHFNEVFLDDVRVDASAMVGGRGEGWSVAMTALGNERGSVVAGNANHGAALIKLVALAGRGDEPAVRQSLASIWSQEVIMRALAGRARATRALGRAPGPEGSLLKLLGAQLSQRGAEFACESAGQRSTAWGGDAPDGELLSYELMYSRMASIAGGTNEIQRNIIGERVLGLPREPAPG